MERLIRDIEATAIPGFTAVTELLLDLTFLERRKFAALLRKHEQTTLPLRTLDASLVYIELRAESRELVPEQMATSLAKQMGKPAVVLNLRKQSISVADWASATP